jgi:hypothetical protein
MAVARDGRIFFFFEWRLGDGTSITGCSLFDDRIVVKAPIGFKVSSPDRR